MSPSFSSLCRALAWLSWMLLALSILGLIGLACLLGLSVLPEIWAADFLGRAEALQLVLWQKVGLWVLAVIGMAPIMLAFSELGKLFQNFSRGAVFTDHAAAMIRSIGLLLIISALLTVVVGAARSILVTATNAPGERMLAISFGSEQVILILLGGFLVVIGQAMAEAARMQDENRSFI